MIDLAQALADLVNLFQRMGLRYAVMGGIAVRALGIPRPTHDVDFTIAIDRARLPELYQAVAEIGYTVPEAYENGWVDQVAGMPLVRFRLYLEGRGVDIDVFLAESPFQELLLSRSRPELVDDLTVSLVSPEDLILLKLVAYRPRDIADIGDVLFTQGKLDFSYMRPWAKQLGVLDRLEKVIADHNLPL